MCSISEQIRFLCAKCQPDYSFQESHASCILKLLVIFAKRAQCTFWIGPEIHSAMQCAWCCGISDCPKFSKPNALTAALNTKITRVARLRQSPHSFPARWSHSKNHLRSTHSLFAKQNLESYILNIKTFRKQDKNWFKHCHGCSDKNQSVFTTVPEYLQFKKHNQWFMMPKTWKNENCWALDKSGDSCQRQHGALGKRGAFSGSCGTADLITKQCCCDSISSNFLFLRFVLSRNSDSHNMCQIQLCN